MKKNMAIVNKGLKVRIYPTSEQKEMFANNFGASRFVYNKYGLIR